MLDPTFAQTFVATKERIRNMAYRYVEEADQKSAGLAGDILRGRAPDAVQRLWHPLAI
jgi:hypothetical protein